jgi:methionine synthase II (cobalamin-independent)
VTPDAPWPPGSATGIGSLPGTDIAEAIRTVLGELPDLPHLPELPGRGAGADMFGRGAGLLVELPVELAVSGWRMTGRPGRELRRTLDLLDRDVDTLAEQADGYTGALKIQVTGPWTLAASVELPHGEKVLADHGATRDLVASLAEGVSRHVADVRRRVPGASVILQVDEPSLPAVLSARVPTASGFATLRSVEVSRAEGALAQVIGAAGVPVVVHCCAPDVPLELIHRSGAAAVSADVTLGLSSARLDALGAVLDGGLGLWAGVVPSVDSVLSEPGASVSAVRTLWRQLGFAPELLAGVVVTPTCGLAGASPAYARAALELCRKAARTLVEDPQG